MTIQIHSHIDASGTLHIEGLHQIANQDVTVILSALSDTDVDLSLGEESHNSLVTGNVVADRIMAISKACSSLPILDTRSPEEILGYNDIGLPE